MSLEQLKRGTWELTTKSLVARISTSNKVTNIKIKTPGRKRWQLHGEYDGKLYEDGYGLIHHYAGGVWKPACGVNEDAYFKIIAHIKPDLIKIAETDPSAIEKMPLYYFTKPFENHDMYVAHVGSRWYADAPLNDPIHSLEIDFSLENVIAFDYQKDVISKELPPRTLILKNIIYPNDSVRNTQNNFDVCHLDENNKRTPGRGHFAVHIATFNKAMKKFEPFVRHAFEKEGADIKLVANHFSRESEATSVHRGPQRPLSSYPSNARCPPPGYSGSWLI